MPTVPLLAFFVQATGNANLDSLVRGGKSGCNLLSRVESSSAPGSLFAFRHHFISVLCCRCGQYSHTLQHLTAYLEEQEGNDLPVIHYLPYSSIPRHTRRRRCMTSEVECLRHARLVWDMEATVLPKRLAPRLNEVCFAPGAEF